MIADWSFDLRGDMQAALRPELPADIVDPLPAGHPDRLHITYEYVLFAAVKPKPRRPARALDNEHT